MYKVLSKVSPFTELFSLTCWILTSESPKGWCYDTAANDMCDFSQIWNAEYALASITKEKQFDSQRTEATFHQNWGGAACYEAPCTERPLRLQGLTAAAQSNETSPPRAEGRWVNPERNKGGQRVHPLLLRNNPSYYTHPFGSFGRPWQDESKVYSKKARAVPAGSSRVSWRGHNCRAEGCVTAFKRQHVQPSRPS